MYHIVKNKIFLGIIALSVLIVAGIFVFQKKDVFNCNWGYSPQQVIAAEGKQYQTWDDALMYKRQFLGHTASIFFNFRLGILTTVCASISDPDNSVFAEAVKYYGGEARLDGDTRITVERSSTGDSTQIVFRKWR